MCVYFLVRNKESECMNSYWERWCFSLFSLPNLIFSMDMGFVNGCMVYFIICSCIVCFKPIRAFCSDKDDWRALIVSDTDLEMISSVRAVEITAFRSTKHSLIIITCRISPEEQKALSVTPTYFFQMIVMGCSTRRTVMNDIIYSIFFCLHSDEAGVNQTSSCTPVVWGREDERLVKLHWPKTQNEIVTATKCYG